MNILNFLRKKHASIHWYGQRFTAFLLLPILLWILLGGASLAATSPDLSSLLQGLVQNHPYLFLGLNVVLFWHIRTGVESIVDDYVHDEKTKFFSYLAIRILTIQLIQSFYFFTVAFL